MNETFNEIGNMIQCMVKGTVVKTTHETIGEYKLQNSRAGNIIYNL